MGVKRRRIPVCDIIIKNGKTYARKGTRNHLICDCKVFYMNCMDCNDKLARRKSDYIPLMVRHARQSSVRRSITRPHENHEFDVSIFYNRILDRIISSGFECECILCCETGFRQRLSVRGANKMSVDRKFDHIGYTHPDQILRLVSKSHHSSQQRDAIPEVSMKRRRKWIQMAMWGISKRSKKRYNRTSKEIVEMENAGMDVTLMREVMLSHDIDTQKCTEMIMGKREETPNCVKCSTKLDFGDKDGILVTTNNPNQASVNRIDNRIGYTKDNVELVCCACQVMEIPDEIPDVFLSESELSDLIDYISEKAENNIDL
jgi:hypothetical protein